MQKKNSRKAKNRTIAIKYYKNKEEISLFGEKIRIMIVIL